jgi:hypothetical protein
MRMGRLTGLGLVLAAAFAVGSISPLWAQSQPVPSQDQLRAQMEMDPAKRKPVPFELVANHILFKAQVNGRDVWAMLDNGSGRTVIDTGFARASGIQLGEPSGQLQTVTGAFVPVRRVPDVGITIPGQGNFQATLLTMDLSWVSRGLGRPISLVVGKDLFEALAFVVRPSSGTFEFWPNTTAVLPPQVPRLELPAGAAPIILANDVPQIQVSIGGKPALLAVDLGDGNVVSVNEKAWLRLGLGSAATIKGTSVGFDARPVATRTTIVGTMIVGPATGYDVSVTAGPDGPDGGDGRLGMGFFAHYDFAIDLLARRIWLYPNGPAGQALHVPKDAAEFESDRQIAEDAARAVELYRSGRKQEAEKRLAALRLLARSDVAANQLCWAQATAGVALDSAIQLCRDVVTQTNRDPAIVDSLGMALLQSGKLDEALAAYNEAIDKAHLAASYMGRAIIHARKGEAALAQADLAEARQRNPGIEAEFAGYGLKLETARAGGGAR